MKLDDVRHKIYLSVWDSVQDTAWTSVGDSVWASVYNFVWGSDEDSIWGSTIFKNQISQRVKNELE
jgi:hypothetical protein